MGEKVNYNEEIPDGLKKEIARAFDMEEGKTILVPLDDTHAIRTDFRCMDKDTDVCDECKLKFKCYPSQYLTIDKKELNLENIGQTINEKVEKYIGKHKPDKKKPDSEVPSNEQVSS